MNLALPALVLLYLALPGFLIVKASRGRLAQGSNEPVVNLSAMTVGFVMAMLLAPALHLLWICLVEVFTRYTIDLSTVGYLLAGAYQNTDRFNEAIADATRHPLAVLIYFATLCLFAVVLGRWLHVWVIDYKLDRKVSWLRFNNEWHYLFSAPQAEAEDKAKYEHGTRVAVTIKQGETVYLYTGLLETYALTADGKLDRLVLIEPVYRRPLTSDPAFGEEEQQEQQEEQRGAEPDLGDVADRVGSKRYYKIPGDRFVAWARDITTLNVDYLYLVPLGDEVGQAADDAPDAAAAHADGHAGDADGGGQRRRVDDPAAPGVRPAEGAPPGGKA